MAVHLCSVSYYCCKGHFSDICHHCVEGHCELKCRKEYEVPWKHKGRELCLVDMVVPCKVPHVIDGEGNCCIKTVELDALLVGHLVGQDKLGSWGIVKCLMLAVTFAWTPEETL
jgi:hypothetical protein